MTRRRWVAAAMLVCGAGIAVWGLGLPADGLDLGDGLRLSAPRMLALWGLLPPLMLPALWTLSGLGRGQLGLGLLLRVLGVGSLAVALASPVREAESTDVALGVLVDTSDSITDGGLERARQRIAQLEAARGDASIFVVRYARDASRYEPPEGRMGSRLERPTGPGEGSDTDLERALTLAQALLPPRHIPRLLVLGDGLSTRGDVHRAARAAAARGVEVSYARDTGGRPPEVAILGMDVPSPIDVGQPFFVRLRLFATEAGHAHVELRQGGAANGLDPGREIELEAGEQEVALRSVVHQAGPVRYEATILPRGSDTFRENNRFEITPTVPGRPSVLYVEGDRAHAGAFARALEAAQLDVTVRTPAGIPASPAELSNFDLFVLSNVPASAVGAAQQLAIERWVRDQGGGFLMAGGSDGFGLGGWQGTRLARLSPVRMDGQRRRDEPSLALALVIDKSGSMNGMKIELAKEAAKATARMLGPSDYIGVIGFDSQPEHVVRMQSAQNRVSILRDIGRLAPRGGTAIFPALDMAYRDLSSLRARFKHVILLTDGQSPERGISELVEVMRADDITVSTVGLGADVNRTLLAQVARMGGGRSYFTADPRSVPRIFMRETSTVTRSAAVEDYFVPRRAAPADFLRGVDLAHAPYLRGYVATQARPSPAQVVLVSDLGEPILARWRVGLGWSLAWTSDLTERWASEWLRWPQFSRFAAQLVREHMRQRQDRSLPLEATLEEDEVRVRIDAIDHADAIVDNLSADVQLLGPGDEEVSAPIEEVGPGQYEARLPLRGYGSFRIDAPLTRDGRPYGHARGHVERPYPREYALSTGGEETLADLATATGGRADPDPGWLFAPRGHRVVGDEPLWPWFVGLTLALFLLDLLLRRVRLGRASRRPMVA